MHSQAVPAEICHINRVSRRQIVPPLDLCFQRTIISVNLGKSNLKSQDNVFHRNINCVAVNEVTRALRVQDEAWHGARGATLQAVNKNTGEKLTEYELEHVPVFDGMAASGGSLFIPLKNGIVVCMAE